MGFLLKNIDQHTGWKLFSSRSLSDVQETAQLLCGEDMPNMVLSNLLAGSDTGEVIGVLNLTPYDSALEMALLKKRQTDPGRKWESLSLSTDLTTLSFAETTSAMFLMEDMRSQTPKTISGGGSQT